MTAALVPTDTYPASFLVASDGDIVGNATRVAVQQTYADAIDFLYNRQFPTSGIIVPAILQNPVYNGGADFVWTPGDGCWEETGGVGSAAAWPVEFPRARFGLACDWKLTLITIYTQNDTGHGGLDPAVDQNLSLDYTKASDGSITNVTSFSDPSAAATLDTLHSWTSAALSHVPLEGMTYVLTYTGESGANAVPDTRITGVFFKFEAV